MRNGKTALVTGSSRGIGRGVAIGLAKAGYDIAIHYNSSEKEGKEVFEEVKSYGVNSCLLSGDTGNQEVPGRLVRETVRKLGRLDVLVANAGIFRDVKLMDLTSDLIDRVYAVNFRGMILAASEAARYFVENGIHGNIIINTSVRAFNAHSGDSIYGGLKAGMNRAIESFAIDLGRYGIRVNGFAPGVINIACSNPQEEKEHPFYKNTCRFIPVRKNGYVENMADVVVWLASDASSYVHGAVIKADGGLSVSGAPEDFRDLYDEFDIQDI